MWKIVKMHKKYDWYSNMVQRLSTKKGGEPRAQGLRFNYSFTKGHYYLYHFRYRTTKIEVP